MTHLIPRYWKIALLLFIPFLVSFACLPSGFPGGSPTQGVVTVQADVVFGPGTFNFPNTKAGLSDLSSYKSIFTLAFDGTRSGKPQKWSKTYVMLNTKEPAMRQLTIEKAGDLANLDPVFVAEAEGAAYERRGKNSCNATVIEAANSLAGQLEPAGFLTGVVGAEVAGSETVNSVPADHYTFDERAFGQMGLAQSMGEMWVASQGGYIVRYKVTTKGSADYFGEGIEGTLTLDYELTDVNKPVTIKLPADCPAGMVNAPLLPDASNVLNVPSVVTYDTSSGLADAVAFYQKQIPNLGWKLLGNPTVTATTTLLDFTQKDQEMSVILTSAQGGTKVKILLSRSQK
jgi:hypothetical protein